MSLEEYFGDWLRVIDRNELNIVMNKLSVLYSTKLICPNQKDVFKAFHLCPLKSLNIVMLAQDPYPQKGVATGLAFANKGENTSPSLNIVKECCINYEIPHNCITFDNSLENWAKQGILLLNSALTVEMDKPNSHTMLWRQFISKLLKNLSINESAIIYVLFGRQAQTFKPYINSKSNYIIEMEHPAYFARNHKKMPYSLFISINDILNGLIGKKIEWYGEQKD